MRPQPAYPCLPVVLTAVLIAGLPLPVAAQSPQPAQASPDDELRDLLNESQRLLEAQAALIEALQERIATLEREVRGAPAEEPTTGAPAPPVQPAQDTAPPPTGAAEPEGPEQEAPAGQGPGTFEVDEDAAERALERTLVQEGALLLPFGRAEVSPSLAYIRRTRDRSAFIQSGGEIFPADADEEEDELIGDVEARLGLPWDSQIEVAIPVVYNHREEFIRSSFPTVDAGSDSALGLCDIQIGFARTLLREHGWRPDPVGRITWDSDTGGEENGITLGSGFHELTSSLNALKRHDPLAFTVGAFYEKAFDDNGVDPGDQYGFSVGTILATSPDTSLNFGFQQSFSQEASGDVRDIPGSDSQSASVTLGASSVLAPGVLLSVTAGIGLTEDAPDYFLSVSLPIGFNTPLR